MKDQSTRIVGWGYNNTNQQYVMRIMATDRITQQTVANSSSTGLLINGRPFNGTGFGLNPTPIATNPTLLDAARLVVALSRPAT